MNPRRARNQNPFHRTLNTPCMTIADQKTLSLVSGQVLLTTSKVISDIPTSLVNSLPIQSVVHCRQLTRRVGINVHDYELDQTAVRPRTGADNGYSALRHRSGCESDGRGRYSWSSGLAAGVVAQAGRSVLAGFCRRLHRSGAVTAHRYCTICVT